MRRGLRLILALLPFCLTLALLTEVLSHNPFARPLVARTAQELRLTLEREMAREVTPDWLIPRFETALAEGDLDRLEMLTTLAGDYDVPLPESLRDRAAALAEAKSGWIAQAASCGRCAYDITACDSMGRMAACALPVELSPLGDANALRRASADYLSGREVDRIEVGLALAGLGATGAVVATGGGSVTVKAGASLLRTARRMGSLSPTFLRVLRDMSDLRIDWARLPGYALGRARLDEVADAGRIAALGALASDLGQVRRHTSLAETLVLLRHVDSAEDAARLARVAEAAGPRTRHAFDVLGKGRVFRALVRVSNLALAGAALIYATILQILLFAGNACSNALLRGLRRALRPAEDSLPPRAGSSIIAVKGVRDAQISRRA